MGVGQRAPSGRSASGLAQPNNPLELTAHSVGFVVVRDSVPVGRSSAEALGQFSLGSVASDK